MGFLSKQRTIVMITNNYTPYSGGVVSSLLSTVAELRRLGYRVIIVTFDFLADGSQEPDVIRLRCAARFMYRKNHCIIPWRMSAQLTKIFDELQPDLIHVHHPFLLCRSAVRLAQQRAIPIVFTHHTLYEDYVHYLPIPACFSRPLTQWWVARFCKQVHSVIVPGESIKQYLAKQGVTNTTVVPSGILPCFVAKASESMQTSAKKASFLNEPIELLTVSRFVPEKSIEFLLDVIARLGPGYRLTLVGYGASGQALRDYAYEQLALSQSQVRFIEQPPKEQLCELYGAAHLFLFASVTETQGLVLAEAMAFGTPVIARRGPGVVDCVTDGSNGYLINSVDEMVARIRELSAQENQVRYQAFQQEALRTSQNYYPERTVKKLVDLYEAVLRDRNS